jgi:hypothetical protein
MRRAPGHGPELASNSTAALEPFSDNLRTPKTNRGLLCAVRFARMAGAAAHRGEGDAAASPKSWAFFVPRDGGLVKGTAPFFVERQSRSSDAGRDDPTNMLREHSELFRDFRLCASGHSMMCCA